MFLTTDRLGRLTRSRFAAPVAVALAILVLTINEVGFFTLARTSVARDEALDARVIIGILRRATIEAESAQRGFLLTQRDSYRAMYERAIRNLDIAVAQVEVLAVRPGAPRESLQRLANTARDKATELRSVVRMSDDGDRAGAIAMIQTDKGRDQM